MSKVINRSITLVGELRKVGTPVVRVLELDRLGMVFRASGATVPTDADKGYQKGCIFMQTDGVSGTVLYVNVGTSASADFNSIGSEGGGGGGGSLNGAYEAGRTIEVDSGAIVITDAQATAHTFDIDRTGTGSGDIFNIKLENAATGRVFYIDMDDAIAANAIVIDSGGTARTGSDIVFTDDSTGTHIELDVNKSGTGATTALDYTDTHAGSSSSFGAKFTMGNSNGLSTTAIQIVRGTGARTTPAIDINDDSTGNVALIDLDFATGVYTGDVINVKMAAAATTGAIFQLDLDAGVAYRAMYVDFGAGTRTVDAIEVKADGAGNKGLLLVTESNTGSGPLVDIDVTGIGSGNVVDITYSAADTGDALKVVMADNIEGGALVITGAGARTDNLIDVVSSETGSVDGMVLLQTTGVFTGHMLTVHSDGAATTGGLIHLDLDAGVAYKAITLDLAGARTVEAVLVTFDGTFGSGAGGTFLNADITMTGSSASPFVDVDITGAYTGNLIDVLIGASLATGDIIKIDLGATATGSQALVIASGAMARTTALIGISDAGTNSGGIIFDIDSTGARTAVVFDIDDTAITTGDIFDYATNSASTGTIFDINMTNAVEAKGMVWTTAGARTSNLFTFTDSQSGAVDIFEINNAGTSSGMVFDINVSTAFTGNVVDITYSGTAIQGNAIKIEMATNLAGNAIFINRLTGNEQTAPLIYVENTGTDGGTNDHDLFIKQIGVLDSAMVQLTFATGVSTGDALNIAMDTDVAGRAIAITSAGTGVNNEGNAIDIAHTGILVAGADVVSIVATGAISSTSNALYIATIGDAGAYALKINATGSAEGLHVDAGTVLIDETLTVTGAAATGALTVTGAATVSTTLGVTGATTLAAALILSGTETIASGGTTTALSLTKSVHYVDADAGGDIFTLADGTAGQITTVLLTSSTGVATITPANLAGGTSVTLNADGDSVVLQFMDTEWFILGGNSYTVI